MQASEDRTIKILRTGLALLSVQSITWTTTLVGVLILPRFLGPKEFGLLTAAGATTSLLAIIAGFGSTNYLIKETARDREGTTHELVLNVIAVRACIWLALSLAVGIQLALVPYSTTVRVFLLLSLAAGPIQLAIDAMIAGFQGNQRLGKVSALTSVLGIVTQCVLVGTVVAGGGVVGIGIVVLLQAVVGLFAVGTWFLLAFPGHLSLSAHTFRTLIRNGVPYLAWDLGLKLYASIDVILLTLLAGSSMVGAYGFAARLMSVPVFATTIITMAVYPALSAAAVHDTAWFGKVVSNAARLTFTVTMPMCTGLAVMSAPVVHWLSGDGYAASAVPMSILAARLPLAAVSTVLGMSLFARDKQKRMAAVAWGATGFNLTSNLVAIPLATRLWENGAIGAASSAVATELLVSAFVWTWAWRSIATRELILAMFRVVIASAALALSAVIAYRLGGLGLGILAGVVTYLAVGVGVGAFSVRHVIDARKTLMRGRAAVPV